MRYWMTVLGVGAFAAAAAAQAPGPVDPIADVLASKDRALAAWRTHDPVAALAEATRARAIVLAVPGADAALVLEVRHLYAMASKRVGLGTGTPETFQWNELWNAEMEFNLLLADPRLREDAETWYHLAHLHAEMAPRNGSFVHVLATAALGELDPVVGLAPAHDRGQLLRGRILGNPVFASVFDADAAVAAFEADVRITPDREESWVRMCELRMQHGHPDAPRLVEAALAVRPDCSKLLQMQGVIREAQTDLAGAIVSFRAAAAADPGNLGALEQWVGALIAEQQQRGQPAPDAVAAQLAAFALQHPAAWKAREMRGALLAEIGKVDAAVTEFQRLERDFPGDPRVDAWLVMQADALRRVGREAELVAVVRRALERDPKADEAVRRLATPEGEPLFDHFKRTSRWDKALWLAEALLPALGTGDREQRERRAVVLWVAFEAHQNLGRPADAERCIREAIAVNPRDPMYPNAYGLMLRYQGRVEEACAQWRAALEVRVDHPWSRENLVATHLSHARFEAACADVVAGLEWMRAAEEQAVPAGADSPAAAAAKFEHAKMRRLGIEAWRLGRLPN